MASAHESWFLADKHTQIGHKFNTNIGVYVYVARTTTSLTHTGNRQTKHRN